LNKILLVDGMNLLFQMFYGMPARIPGKDGRAIQGTLGFVGALLKTIRREQPTHVAVVFDGECHNERRDLDENYKANRPDWSQEDQEDIPFSQLPDIYRALDALGICHRETEDCEADDWIASFARTLGAQHPMVILSQDSDFFQLITDKVHILRYRGENSVLCDEAYIREKLGITPAQYADFKSLTGDASDNIRGADKIGPKTAAQLIRQLGSLENILSNAGQVTKPSVRNSLLEHQNRLRTNYKLIYLPGDAPLPFSLEEMSYTHRHLTTTQVLQMIGLR